MHVHTHHTPQFVRPGRALCVGLALIAAAFCAQAELTATIEPEEASRFVYEPFRIRLTPSEPIDFPELESGAGYSVLGIEEEADTDYFLIELIAEEAGTLTLPPISITAGEQTAHTPVTRLPIGAPRVASEMSLSAEFSTQTPYAGQPIEMTVIWSNSVPFTRCQELLLEIPLLRNAAWDIYLVPPDVPEKERIGLPVNAQRIIAKNEPTRLSFRYHLVPHEEGLFTTDARLSCALLGDRHSSSQYPSYFDNHFFNTPSKRDRYERVYLASSLPDVTVLPLPAEGRTVHFSGLVGSLEASAAIEPADTVVGQPMLLTVTLNHLQFGEHIQNLPEATLDGLGPEFSITRDPMHTKTEADSKSFTYIVRPLRSGVTTLPALTFDIFDPDQKAYRTVRTAPLSIRVEPNGEETVYVPAEASNARPLEPLTGIRNNRKESKATMNAYTAIEFLAHHGWFFWVFPPVLFILLLPLLRRYERCKVDPIYARALRARTRFMTHVGSDEHSAWKTYLADRLDLHAEAITKESVESALKQRGVDDELIQAVRARFEQEEAAGYAPPGTPVGRADAIKSLVSRLHKATPLALLLFCLLPALNTRAETADQRFEQAMQIRAERPDEAQPLFEEAALEYEAEGAFYNAANSWFHADKNGRALANYRSAESRRPYNREIREAIEFIRVQRTDKFKDVEKATSHYTRPWKRFCRRSPELRFGVLTLLYLIGWVVVVIVRLRGKKIPLKTAIVYCAHATFILATLIWSAFQPREGVTIQSSEARLGPGYAYEPAYDTLLHEAVEFQWLDEKDGWVHVRMPDESLAWIRETACVQIK